MQTSIEFLQKIPLLMASSTLDCEVHCVSWVMGKDIDLSEYISESVEMRTGILLHVCDSPKTLRRKPTWV